MAGNTVFRVYDDAETMLKVYNRRLRIADKKYESRRPEVEQFFSRYRNEPRELQVTDRGHRVNVTNGLGVVDTLYSSMVAVDVEFIVSAIGNGTAGQAYLATKGLNQAWRDTKGQRQAKKAVKDAIVADLGWVKVYYDYQEDVQTRDKPEAALNAELVELLGENPDISDAEVLKLVKSTEEVLVVLRDRVCVDYVPWDMVRYDPTAKDISDVRWVAQYTPTPTPEVTLNPHYKKFVYDRYGAEGGQQLLDDLEGDSTALTGLEGDYGAIDTVGKDEYQDDQRVTIVEMWDLETGLVTVYPKGHDELILFQRVNPLMFNLDLEDRNPFKPLAVRSVSTQLEGLGDMRVIMPSLDELDEYRSNLATHVSRTIPKVFGPERGLTTAGMKALESQTWMAYVEMGQGHSAAEIQTVGPPQIAQEAFALPARIDQEMKEATGANEVMRGVFPSRRTTAAETQLVTSAGQARQAERRGLLEDWYLSIARTMLQLMQLFYDAQRIYRFVDAAGAEEPWQWAKEDIALDADLDIALTPRENLTRQERFERMITVMNLALPMPETDRANLLHRVLSESGILREEDIRAIVKTPEEVQAEQMQSLLTAAPQRSGEAPPGLSIQQFPAGRPGAGG